MRRAELGNEDSAFLLRDINPVDQCHPIGNADFLRVLDPLQHESLRQRDPELKSVIEELAGGQGGEATQ